ncbi:hypothetical protein FRC01_002891, partial [Tulasnella sp. 417]
MSAVITVDTRKDHGWTNLKAKNSMTFNFPETYVAPPRVIIGLSQVDMKHGTNLRVKVYADCVDRQTFTGHADTWSDTTLYSAGMNALILKPGNLDILSGEFDTRDGHPWDEPRRQISRHITFERPFLTPPKVVVFLKLFDTGSGSSTRVRTHASNIDTKGFTIHIATWADTTLHGAIAGWVAYPEDRDYIYSSTAHTKEVRPWDKPQLETQNRAQFRGAKFLKKPTIFMALNCIDISTKSNLRIEAYADNVSTEGMTWHINENDEPNTRDQYPRVLHSKFPKVVVPAGISEDELIPAAQSLVFGPAIDMPGYANSSNVVDVSSGPAVRLGGGVDRVESPEDGALLPEGAPMEADILSRPRGSDTGARIVTGVQLLQEDGDPGRRDEGALEVDATGGLGLGLASRAVLLGAELARQDAEIARLQDEDVDGSGEEDGISPSVNIGGVPLAIDSVAAAAHANISTILHVERVEANDASRGSDLR